MHKGCKQINLRDYKVLCPWVFDCLKRHGKRYDFRKMLIEDYNVSLDDYKKIYEEHNYPLLATVVE